MGRKNVSGSSFLALDLEKSEEVNLKRYLKWKGITSGKQYLRYLVRKDLRELGDIKALVKGKKS